MANDTHSADVDGLVEPGWEPVADRLRASLDDGTELGAAVCVYRSGRPVVDVWGGVADRRTGEAWQRDQVVPVFSSTKGVAAICVHLLAQRGDLDLDAPICHYWPEFVGGGKEAAPVRWILTHQIGLPVLDADLTLDDVRAGEPVLRAIEAQTPLWEPGTQFTYHGMTFGFLVGEIVRRVTGSTIGAFFATEVARPLGLRSWIGLPEDEQVALAPIERSNLAASTTLEALRSIGDGIADVAIKSITLGSAFPLGVVTGEPGDFNDRSVLSIELPAAGMVSDARSLARLYAATVSEVDGVRIFTPETAAACAPIQTSDLPVWGVPVNLYDPATRTLDFGLGFMARPMLGPSSFGHPGASGCMAFADIDHEVGFAYVTNRSGVEGTDSRADELVAALRTCIS